MKATAFVTSKITQPFEGASLRVFYLAERVRCQLVGEDAPHILMDPLVFMLAPKYQLWRNGISYAQWISNELDYEEFNNTQLWRNGIPLFHSLKNEIVFRYRDDPWSKEDLSFMAYAFTSHLQACFQDDFET